jgi:eukaryotic-like serine/threonine-protein kinase
MTFPGDELNRRYRLEERLGSGAMGSVWRAHDKLLERTVALKELVLQRAGIEDLVRRRERARKEARALAKVEHPAIVSIHDLISVEDDPWIVMSYVSGRPLNKIIQDGPPADEQMVASIGLPVLHGLMACHAKGVYHRDVKPANIVVAQDGSVCLVDFGIARIADEYSLTGDSKLLGTPDYLAPELLDSQPAGPSSDLWALGVTLYYALEGRPPFRAASIQATIGAILYKDPPEPRRRGALAAMVLQMLQKKPSERPGTDTIVAVLRSVLSGSTAARRPYWYGPDRAANRPAAAGTPDRPQLNGRTQLVHAAQRTTSLAGLPTADAAGLISSPATDSAVGTLPAMTDTDAARIINHCADDVAGKLVGAIAADQPARAGKILRIVTADRACRVLDHIMSPSAVASVLAALPPARAARIVQGADTLTVVDALPEMPPRSAGTLITEMDEAHAADVLSRVAPVSVAGILNVVSGELRGRLLQRFPVDFRTMVRRYM